MIIKDEEVAETHRDLYSLAIVLLDGARLLQACNPKLNLELNVSKIVQSSQEMHRCIESPIFIYREDPLCACMLHAYMYASPA